MYTNQCQESQFEEGTDDQMNHESQPNLNNQQSVGGYFEGESLAEEYVDQLI